MGEDNLRTLHKWKNFELILKNHSIYVYPRALTEQERLEQNSSKEVNHQFTNHPKITRCDAPVMKVSSSYIRQAIKEKKTTRLL